MMYKFCIFVDYVEKYFCFVALVHELSNMITNIHRYGKIWKTACCVPHYAWCTNMSCLDSLAGCVSHAL